MVRSNGQKYSVIQFLFIGSSGFGLIRNTVTTHYLGILFPGVLEKRLLFELQSSMDSSLVAHWLGEWEVQGSNIGRDKIKSKKLICSLKLLNQI